MAASTASGEGTPGEASDDVVCSSDTVARVPVSSGAEAYPVFAVSRATLDQLFAQGVQTWSLAPLDQIGGPEGLLQRLRVNVATGVRSSEVAVRQAWFGDNQYTLLTPRSSWSLFWSKLKAHKVSVPLMAAVATTSILVGSLTPAFATEWLLGFLLLCYPFWLLFVVSQFEAAGASRYHELLRPHRTSPVIRDGSVLMVPQDQLVVGDIVLLRAGWEVPADGILIDGEVVANQSLLIEEEGPQVISPLLPYLLRHTWVVAGEATMVVTNVGRSATVANVAPVVLPPAPFHDSFLQDDPLEQIAVTRTQIPVLVLFPIAVVLLLVSILGFMSHGAPDTSSRIQLAKDVLDMFLLLSFMVLKTYWNVVSLVSHVQQTLLFQLHAQGLFLRNTVGMFGRLDVLLIDIRSLFELDSQGVPIAVPQSGIESAPAVDGDDDGGDDSAKQQPGVPDSAAEAGHDNGAAAMPVPVPVSLPVPVSVPDQGGAAVAPPESGAVVDPADVSIDAATLVPRVRADVPAALHRLAELNVQVILVSSADVLGAKTLAGPIVSPNQVFIQDAETLHLMSGAQLAQLVKQLNVVANCSLENMQFLVERLRSFGRCVGYLGMGTSQIETSLSNRVDVSLFMNDALPVNQDGATAVLISDVLTPIPSAIEASRLIPQRLDFVQQFELQYHAVNLSAVAVITVLAVYGHRFPIAPIHIFWLWVIGLAVAAYVEPICEPGSVPLYPLSSSGGKPALLLYPLLAAPALAFLVLFALQFCDVVSLLGIPDGESCITGITTPREPLTHTAIICTAFFWLQWCNILIIHLVRLGVTGVVRNRPLAAILLTTPVLHGIIITFFSALMRSTALSVFQWLITFATAFVGMMGVLILDLWQQKRFPPALCSAPLDPLGACCCRRLPRRLHAPRSHAAHMPRTDSSVSALDQYTGPAATAGKAESPETLPSRAQFPSPVIRAPV